MQQNNTSGNNPANTNFNPAEFAGHYTPTGGSYFQNNTSGLLVKVCTRVKQEKHKPREYIMHRTPDGQFRFLTSLYPQPDPDTYRAEVQRHYFTVHYTPDGLQVSPVNSKG